MGFALRKSNGQEQAQGSWQPVKASMSASQTAGTPDGSAVVEDLDERERSAFGSRLGTSLDCSRFDAACTPPRI